MGTVGGYLSAVVAGAMTAGIGAANVLAVPPDKVQPAQSGVSDIDLAASVVIPIIDIGPTPGPLSVWRQLAIEAGTNPLLLGILQQGGNSYDLPGLNTLVNFTANPRVLATQGADYLDFGFLSNRTEQGGWGLLGDVVQSSATTNDARDIHFRPLLGGTEGIGARLYGTLDETGAPITRTFQVLGSGFDSASNRQTGVFNAVASVVPFSGSKIAGSGTLVNGNNTTTANLGALQLGAGSSGGLSGDAGLCLGSAKNTNGCGSDTAFAGFNAPVQLELGIGGSSTNIFTVDFPQNNLAVALGSGRFSVTGELGGTVSVGAVKIGRPIDIDFQFPRGSSMLASTADRQTGRHAARDAVNEAVSSVRTAVKTAVSNVTQSKPKHAKPDS